MLFNKLKPGDVISEIQYYLVKDVAGDTVNATMDNGQVIGLSKGYIDKAIMYSADYYENEEAVTKTQLEEILKSHPRTAMTVCYFKQAKEKDIAEQISNLYPNKGKIMSEADFIKSAKKIAKSVTIGEERVIRGRHYNSYGAGGRIQFIDMDITKDESKDYDTRMRLVDPRTIQWIIVNNIKYNLK